MKIIITEKQLETLIEQDSILDTIKKGYEKVTDKVIAFKNVVSDAITGNYKMYKTVIPGIADNYYGKENIKTDAFRHILAAAFFTTTIGDKATLVGGYANELGGAFRNFIKGEGFDSGWSMDTKNNDIGINLGKKYPKYDINLLAKEVKKIVDSGNFYTQNGILFKNDKNPKF